VKKSELDQEISNLKAENERCYNLIIKLSKNEANKNLEGSTAIRDKWDYNLSSPMKTSTKFATSENQDEKIIHKRIRVLTMNQLKDTIHDIMQSKLHNDKKNDETGIGRETIEQYMYTYLTKKYGLKSLVIEWASSIIDVIRNFSQDDNLVLVFAKILRNECDEDFYWVQHNVKSTIKDLILTYYKVKTPLKQLNEVERMVANTSNGTITRGECYDLIKHIYESNDQKIVKAELDMFCAKDNLSVTYGQDYKLRFKDFEEIVLRYQ